MELIKSFIPKFAKPAEPKPEEGKKEVSFQPDSQEPNQGLLNINGKPSIVNTMANGLPSGLPDLFKAKSVMPPTTKPLQN